MTNCENCKYSALVKGEFTSYIECRRYAPRANSSERTFPAVWAADWCGEFELKEQGEREPYSMKNSA
jgi:hypothetical protein